MTWTYSGDPSEERKDEVRFMVGDTTSTTALVQDEEIEYILTLYPPGTGKPAWLAAAHVCDAIAGKFARKVQQGLGPLSASNQQQYEHYIALAAQYRALYASNGQSTAGLGGIKAAAPVLSGGGRTYLGGSAYSGPQRDGPI